VQITSWIKVLVRVQTMCLWDVGHSLIGLQMKQ
jgi:hypothetical protein